MDPDMARAAIAAEDSNFCTHHGFELKAIQKAFERNATGKKKIRGGSTISQQTAKNVFLWQGGGYFRKALEAWFTVLIELVWGKQRIMEVYLNVAETGIGTFGANAGAFRYFNHDATRLSPSEAADRGRPAAAQEARGDLPRRLHAALREQYHAADFRGEELGLRQLPQIETPSPAGREGGLRG
jgi:monofunctional biosynthetic peptidoglycan transglycosylase